MSYILDALRRSEAERKQGQVPDLVSPIHMIPVRKNQVIWWPYLLGAALLVNALVIMYVFWPPVPDPGISVTSERPADISRPLTTFSAADQAQTGMPANTEVLPEAIAAESALPALSVESQSPASARLAGPRLVTVPEDLEPEEWIDDSEPQRIDPSSVAQPAFRDWPASKHALAKPPQLASLPLNIQRRVPDLHFNSHIYSQQASARRVMINNILLREGDRFSGLQLIEITDDGVILSVDGIAFGVGVISDWIAPR